MSITPDIMDLEEGEVLLPDPLSKSKKPKKLVKSFIFS
jgi:hypothetical protein